MKAILKLVQKDDHDDMDSALNYMLNAAIKFPVMVAVSWAGHEAELEEKIVGGIRKEFAEVRERATLRDQDGNKVEAPNETEG